jgi:type I restriction enzyme S subunit
MERCEVSLPNGWVETDLATVIVLMRNGLVTSQEKEPVGIPISRIETISFGIIDFNRVRYVKNIDKEKKQQYLLQIGDILFSHINSDLHLGKTAVYDSHKALLHGMNLLLIRPNQNCITAKYLNYFLNHCRSIGKFISIAQHSVNQSSLNQRKLEKFPIRIAPLAEQKRIVDKIERLFSYLDEGERLLEQVQKQITTYRQAVLKAAVTGELTKEWRAANRDNIESGEELLQRILDERQKSWKGRGKYEEPVAPNTNSLTELPKGWVWTSLDSLVTESQNGLSKRNGESGYAVDVIRLADIVGDQIKTRELRQIVCKETEIVKYQLHSGHILCIRVNGSIELVGKFIPYTKTNPTQLFCDHFIRLKPSVEVSSKYLSFWARTAIARNFIEQRMVSSAGQNTVSQGSLLAMPIPLQALAEQLEIVKEIENRHSEADMLDQVILQEIARIASLRRLILKVAFSGKLVDQDPNDEPASELLARIQKEQKQAKASNPRSGRTSKRSASV